MAVIHRKAVEGASLSSKYLDFIQDHIFISYLQLVNNLLMKHQLDACYEIIAQLQAWDSQEEEEGEEEEEEEREEEQRIRVGGAEIVETPQERQAYTPSVIQESVLDSAEQSMRGVKRPASSCEEGEEEERASGSKIARGWRKIASSRTFQYYQLWGIRTTEKK